MECRVIDDQGLRLISELSGTLCGPVAVATDASGSLYVAEEFGQCIKKYNAEKACVWERRVADETSPESVAYPSGLCISSRDELWVTNRWHHCIDVYSLDGDLRHSFGQVGEGPQDFIEPWGIASGSQGQVYIVDKGNARIVVYTADFARVRSFGTCGIPVDFYESERFKRTIHYRRWTANNSRLNTIESRFYDFKYTVGDFEYPENIAISPDGSIYVTDRVSKHVVVFDPEGAYCGLIKHEKNGCVPPLPSSVCAGPDVLCIGDELSGLLYYKSAETEMSIDLAPYGLKPSFISFSETHGGLYIADAWNDRVVLAQVSAGGAR